MYWLKVYGGMFVVNIGNELLSYWCFDVFVEKKIDKNWIMKFYV